MEVVDGNCVLPALIPSEGLIILIAAPCQIPGKAWARPVHLKPAKGLLKILIFQPGNHALKGPLDVFQGGGATQLQGIGTTDTKGLSRSGIDLGFLQQSQCYVSAVDPRRQAKRAFGFVAG